MSDATPVDRRLDNTTAATSCWRSSLPDAFYAQLMGTWRPRTTMRDTETISLPIVYLSHLVTLAFGMILMFGVQLSINYLLRWFSPPAPARAYYDYVHEVWQKAHFAANVLDFIRGAGDLRLWLALGLVMITLESFCLLMSLLGLGWTAGNESTGCSVRRSLRVAWLLTPLPLSWLFCWWLIELPLVGPGRWEFIFHWGVILLYAWSLWVLLRACTARPARSKPETKWCETCGYDLSGTEAESRCPECGEPACESLGTSVRCPAPWESDSGGSVITAYLRTLRDIVFHPIRFCRHMHAYSGYASARTFLIVSVVLAGLLSALTQLSLPAVRGHFNLEDIHCVPAIHVGCLLGTVLLASGGIGLAVSWIQKRPLLAPVAKVFFYLSGVYILLAPGWWLALVLLETGWVKIVDARVVWRLAIWIGTNPEFFPAMALGSVAMLYLVVLHTRGIGQVLYANT